MAYQQSVPYAQQQQLHTQPMGIQTQDIVSGDQYRYALTNFVRGIQRRRGAEH